MGDIAELRGLVVAITFMFTFGILVGYIPSGFYVSSSDYRKPNIPEYFEAVDIYSYAEVWTYVMNETVQNAEGGGYYQDYYYLYNIRGNDGTDVFGGYYFILYYTKANSTSGHRIIIRHVFREWYVIEFRHSMQWYNRQGTVVSEDFSGWYDWHGITEETIDENIENGTVRFTVKCNHVQIDVFIGYNTTKYSNTLDAWDHHDLSMLWGISFDQVQTTFNAWNIIGMILFFQMPDVHPAINLLIGIPIWICIIYLCYVLILKAIPFVGG